MELDNLALQHGAIPRLWYDRAAIAPLMSIFVRYTQTSVDTSQLRLQTITSYYKPEHEFCAMDIVEELTSKHFQHHESSCARATMAYSPSIEKSPNASTFAQRSHPKTKYSMIVHRRHQHGLLANCQPGFVPTTPTIPPQHHYTPVQP
jgi:hypothetical protein